MGLLSSRQHMGAAETLAAVPLTRIMLASTCLLYTSDAADEL